MHVGSDECEPAEHVRCLGGVKRKSRYELNRKSYTVWKFHTVSVVSKVNVNVVSKLT